MGTGDMFENIVLTLCGSFGAYVLGWHLARIVFALASSSLTQDSGARIFEFVCKVLIAVSVAAFACVLVAPVLSNSAAERQELTASLCGGLGSMLRLLLAV